MKANKKQHCRDSLVQRILTLDIEPGSILDETELSRQYELSRTPLREVFQRMAGEGYLTLAANRGAKVSSMDLNRMRTFFQAAGMIYASIARLAAENASEQQIEELKATQNRFKKSLASEDASAIALINHEFHGQIGEMSGNRYLLPSYDRLLIDHTRIGQRFYQPANKPDRARMDTACAQHDDLIHAFEEKSPARAVEITLQHWELSRDRIEQFVRPDPLPFRLNDVDGRHAV